MEIRGIKSKDIWNHENGFNWFSEYSRMAKQIAHWEIYKKIDGIPGDIFELGVYKGLSLIRWATFREITENAYSRKIVGFDAFGKFQAILRSGMCVSGRSVEFQVFLDVYSCDFAFS